METTVVQENFKEHVDLRRNIHRQLEVSMCLLSQLAKPQSQGVTHNSKQKNGIIYLLPRAEHLLWVNTPTTMQKSKYDKKSQVSFQLLSGVGISIDTFHLCQTQPCFVAMYCSCDWGATCCCSSTLMRKPAIGAKSTSSLTRVTPIYLGQCNVIESQLPRAQFAQILTQGASNEHRLGSDQNICADEFDIIQIEGTFTVFNSKRQKN